MGAFIMRLAFLATAAVLFAPAAFAADLSSRDTAPTPPPVASFSWSGAYVGGYAGGVFASNKLQNLSSATDVNLSPSGFTGGVLIGYNYQIDPHAVVGAEAEIGYDGWKGSGSFLNGRFQPRDAESQGTYIGRIRARGGYALDNLLLYVAGGVSFGQDKVTQTNSFVNVSNSMTRNLTGWNIGVGAEYGFTPNWVGRFEYIHDTFGSKTYDFQNLPGTFPNREVKLNENTVRMALAYKF